MQRVWGIRPAEYGLGRFLPFCPSGIFLHRIDLYGAQMSWGKEMSQAELNRRFLP